jgi:ABC-2 type transport system permease protein
MEAWSFLRKFQRSQVRRYLAKQRSAKIITISLFLLVMIAVGLALYLFLSSGFTYLAKEPGIPALIIYYMYELFIFVLALLIIASGIISSLFLLFSGRDQAWVMATPAYRPLFFYQTGKVMFSSMWPLAVLIVPALLAMREVFHLSILNVVLSFLAVLVFTAFLVLMTVVGMMATAWLIMKVRITQKPLFSQLVTTLGLWSFLAAYSVWQWLHSYLLPDLVRIDRLTRPGEAVAVIGSRFMYLPSHLPATIMYSLQAGHGGEALRPFLSLVLLLLAAGLMFAGFSYEFLPVWQLMQEGNLQAKATGTERTVEHSLFIRFLGKKPGAVRSFLGKEALMLYRDKKHFLWFSFLVFIWLVQTALVSGIGHSNPGHAGLGSLQPTLQALQFLVTVYFVSTFVLRFVFPSFSMESRTAWIIASAPLDLRKVMYAKLAFYSLLLMVLGCVMGGINIYFLQLPLSFAIMSIVAFVLSIVCLVTLGLMLGIVFPNFDTDDPQILSTSLPGLVFIFLALGYGGVGSLFLYFYVENGALIPIGAFLVISVILLPLMVRASESSLVKLEMVKTV